MSPLPLTLDVATEDFAYAKPFAISGHTFTKTQVVVAALSDGIHVGRGEAAGAYYLQDDSAAMLAAIERVRPAVEQGCTRAELQQLLPPCGARNALDCAFWELESGRSGKPVWQLAGVPAPRPLRTTITLGADDPSAMAASARALVDAKALKLKLTGEAQLDSERVSAVRAARPDCWIGVDANQGYVREDLDELVKTLLKHDVKLLEQPLARGREADLHGIERRMPFAADESALSLADLDGLVGRFDVVNIKLDKCGGLTEGLAIAAKARDARLGRDGRQHDGHQPVDGSIIRAWPNVRYRRPGRADLPCHRPHAIRAVP